MHLELLDLGLHSQRVLLREVRDRGARLLHIRRRNHLLLPDQLHKVQYDIHLALHAGLSDVCWNDCEQTLTDSVYRQEWFLHCAAVHLGTLDGFEGSPRQGGLLRLLVLVCVLRRALVCHVGHGHKGPAAVWCLCLTPICRESLDPMSFFEHRDRVSEGHALAVLWHDWLLDHIRTVKQHV